MGYEKKYPGYPGIPLGVGLEMVSDLKPVVRKKNLKLNEVPRRLAEALKGSLKPSKIP